jgi:homoserine kinase
MTWLIRVPATSANLGPGFDCLGLALDLWNEVEVHLAGESLSITLEGEGERHLPLGASNGVVHAMISFAEWHHQTLPEGIHLHCRNHIPLGSGLGSSAVAAVAGILAAEALLGLPAYAQKRLECATRLEGHPDNVAPCLMGGLTASMVDENTVIARNLPVADLALLVVTPNFILPTHKARAALPKTIPHSDAVFNLSRSVLLTQALATGDLEQLSTVMVDRLHQPYRLPIIPGAEQAISAGQKAGAAAVVLSGAGPSLLAVLRSAEDSKIVARAMQQVFLSHGLESRVFNPGISRTGATTTLI